MARANVTGEHHQRIFWSPDEFDAIARAILARFPQLHFEQVRSAQDIDLSLRELLDSAKAALPPERYRNMSNTGPMKIGLVAAFARLRGEVVSATLDGHVRWNDQEWHYVANALERLFPREAYCSSGRLDQLTLAHLNTAAATLPTGRQRYFNALTGVRERLLAAYGAPAAAATVAATVAAPRKRHKHVRVYWTKVEWLQVAAELLRRDPKLAGDPTLTRVSSKDIKRAQKVLPAERQRHGLHDMHRLRLSLQEPLARVIREGLLPPAAVTPALPLVVPAPELAAPEPVLAAVPETTVALPAVADGGNAWEAACRPLVTLLVDQLANGLVAALLPELVAQLRPLLAAALPQPAQPPAAPQSAAAELEPAPTIQAPPARPFPFIAPPRPAAPAAEPTYSRAPAPGADPASVAPKPKAPPKPRVGVVGPLGDQQRTLEAAFPNVKLVFVESDKQNNAVDTLRSCERVIGMIGFMKHSTDHALHKHFNRPGFDPIYTRVTGGVTALKLQIEAWLKTGAHFQSQARGNRAVSA